MPSSLQMIINYVEAYKYLKTTIFLDLSFGIDNIVVKLRVS